MITLDKEQELAVKSTAKNILVVASAGSGKTRVLTERIRHLIVNKNVTANNIIAITFTNQAASEMQDRLKDLPGISSSFIGTIHSLAYRALKSSGEKFKLMTEDTERDLHIELIKKYCTNLTVFKYIKYLQLRKMYRLKRVEQSVFKKYLTPEERHELWQLDYGTPTDKFKETFSTLCNQRNVITFEELLQKVLAYFRDTGMSSNYVFVDEFQDISDLEYDFIMALKADNYFFVGDDWQSIYSFKGSNIELIRLFLNNDDWVKFYLTYNYRSCTSIVTTSLDIMSKVKNKTYKKVTPFRHDKGSVRMVTDISLDAELKRIKKDYSKWFVLTRSRSDAAMCYDKLKSFNIPCEFFDRDGASQEDIDKFMNNDTVKVMTIHASKGLENDNVILFGNFSVNSSFNKVRYENSPNYTDRLFKFEEEKRIFYVGATRARNSLVIIRKSFTFNQNNNRR